jgi:hypothetical protein
MDKGVFMLAHRLDPDPHGGGWTRGRRRRILLGPFTVCVRAWRSEIARETDPGLLDAFHERTAFVKAVVRAVYYGRLWIVDIGKPCA